MFKGEHCTAGGVSITNLGYGTKPGTDIRYVSGRGEGEDIFEEVFRWLDPSHCDSEPKVVKFLNRKLEFLGIKDDPIIGAFFKKLARSEKLLLNCVVPDSRVINTAAHSVKILKQSVHPVSISIPGAEYTLR